MDKDELAKIAEKGVSELDLEWPLASSIYELQIPRVLKHPDGTEQPVLHALDYLEFLRQTVFPLVDQLEKEAEIDYWHILNHPTLDLRLSIHSGEQRQVIDTIIKQHGFDPATLRKWGPYDDPDLGSRLGCQALLRLFQAQSRFARDMVRSIYWLREKSSGEVRDSLESHMLETVPIYTSHMLLNIFPADPFYEAFAHLNEAHFRFHHLLENGVLPHEAEKYLNHIQSAQEELQKILQ